MVALAFVPKVKEFPIQRRKGWSAHVTVLFPMILEPPSRNPMRRLMVRVAGKGAKLAKPNVSVHAVPASVKVVLTAPPVTVVASVAVAATATWGATRYVLAPLGIEMVTLTPVAVAGPVGEHQRDVQISGVDVGKR